jgi:Dynein heavy chain AAA lid domain
MLLQYSYDSNTATLALRCHACTHMLLYTHTASQERSQFGASGWTATAAPPVTAGDLTAVLAFLERNVYSGSAINWPAVQCLTADICYGGSATTAATNRRVTAAFAEAWLMSSLGASLSFCFNLKSAVAPPAAVTATAVVSGKLSLSNAQQQPQLQQQQRRETGATAAALAAINKSSSKSKGASSGAAAAAAAAKHRYTAPAHTELAEVVQFINSLPESDAPAILGLHTATCATAVMTAGHTLWSSVVAATSSTSTNSSVSSAAAAATQRCVELATLLNDMLADAGYAALHEGTVSAVVTPMEAFIQCEGALLCEQLTTAAAAVEVLQQALSGQVSCYTTHTT